MRGKTMNEIIVAITGSSGIEYGIKLVNYLHSKKIPTIVIVSEGAKKVAKFEVEMNLDMWLKNIPNVKNNDNLAASIASGSYPTSGMIICPCSSKTLSLIANDIELNLIVRTAMCQLKEGRKIVIVPRETPISIPYIKNLLACAQAGIKIVPAMPGFYHKPDSIDDLLSFVVGKALDQLDIEHNLFERWK